MDSCSIAMGGHPGVEVVGGDTVLEGHHIEAHKVRDLAEHRMDLVVQARSVHVALGQEKVYWDPMETVDQRIPRQCYFLVWFLLQQGNSEGREQLKELHQVLQYTQRQCE